MSRFEREIISKKVHLASQIFAILAGLGILIIGLQFFSKTTGIDLFNINYSLAKLFLDEETKTKNSNLMSLANISSAPIATTENSIENMEGITKAADLLKNYIQLAPTTLTESINTNEKNSNSLQKFSLVKITSLTSTGNIFTPGMGTLYYKNISQYGILPQVKNIKYSKWSIGISLTPGASYRHIKYTNMEEIITRQTGNTQYGFYQTRKERNTNDKGLMKYSIGFDVIYRINNKVSIQSGLTYLNTGESVLVKEIFIETNPQINQSGTGPDYHSFFEGKPDFESPKDVNSEDNFSFANNLSYFEIPVSINYRLKTINSLSDIELQAGVTLTRLDFVNAMVYNFNNDGYYLITGSNPEVFRKYGSNAILGIIYNKYITNAIELFANPQIKVGLTNVFHSEYNIDQHYYNAGIRLGMKINL